ncbi:class I SAM-dependent methyltransferase [Fodinicola acaciae]|uniref:class I SAM-dependent methyltransferase n=1 Tax=Fodinicola acaciae TaxID=2681555 RepID=UPI0013D89877|nr:class I SAM-dependent methyltransferase [Fodinicola acaciae]
MDWSEWHRAYDEPDSHLSQRLRIVRERIREVLDTAPPGPLTAVSICAGQGRDLLEVLAHHPRREDVRARLVELDPELAAYAGRKAPPAVEVVTGDASLLDQYAGFAPADLVIACGIFGNITEDDIRQAVGCLDQLCRTGGSVIWTRHRREPDLVPTICRWFEEAGFELRWVSGPAGGYGVAMHRFTGTPRPLVTGERMFTFVGHDAL